MGFICAYLVNLFLRSDGYFPFPKSIGPAALRGVALVHTFILLGLTIALARQLFRRAQRPLKAISPLWIWPVGVAAISVLHYFSYLRFQNLGYQNRWELWLALTVASAAAMAWSVKRENVYGLILSAMLLKLYPLWAFPVNAYRSDMLPILQAAGDNFLHGKNIYQYYLLSNGVYTQMVRFPGLVFSYLPAVVGKFDLRWMILLYETVFFVAWVKFFPRSKILPVLLAAWLFFPYWHYRHELYEAPYWLATLLLIFSLERKIIWLEFLLIGPWIAFHQWSFLLAPFIAIYSWRRQNFWPTFLVFAFGGFMALGLVQWASRGEWGAFFYHVYFYYADVLKGFAARGDYLPQSLYLTPELARVLSPRLLSPLSWSLQAALWVWAAQRLATLHELCTFLALALSAWLILNPIAWTYQYLLVGLLFSAALLAQEKISA